MDARTEKIALFRYALIAPLVVETLPRGELTRRAEEIAARQYEIPYSERTSLSVDTLLDWALRYRRGGFPALAPQPRRDRGQSRVVPPPLAELIERLKRENPHRTGMTLLRELALVSGTDSPAISAATLYRFLKQRRLTTRQLLALPEHKKFEAERSNQIWQSDMLFGPYVQRPGGGRMTNRIGVNMECLGDGADFPMLGKKPVPNLGASFSANHESFCSCNPEEGRMDR